MDIDNYLTEDNSFYSINDFSNLDDVSIINGKGNALTVNVYETIWTLYIMNVSFQTFTWNIWLKI